MRVVLTLPAPDIHTLFLQPFSIFSHWKRFIYPSLKFSDAFELTFFHSLANFVFFSILSSIHTKSIISFIFCLQYTLCLSCVFRSHAIHQTPVLLPHPNPHIFIKFELINDKKKSPAATITDVRSLSESVCLVIAQYP